MIIIKIFPKSLHLKYINNVYSMLLTVYKHKEGSKDIKYQYLCFMPCLFNTPLQCITATSLEQIHVKSFYVITHPPSEKKKKKIK